MNLCRNFDYMFQCFRLNKFKIIQIQKTKYDYYNKDLFLVFHQKGNFNAPIFSNDDVECLKKHENSFYMDIECFNFKAIFVFQTLCRMFGESQSYDMLKNIYSSQFLNALLYLNRYILSQEITDLVVFSIGINFLWTDFVQEKLNYFCTSNINSATSTIETPVPVLKLKFSKDHIEMVAKKYIFSQFYNKINMWKEPSLLKRGGVQINGTACVGKTYLLNTICKNLKTKYNKEITIEKPSKYGTFHDKDTNMLMALQLNIVNADCTSDMSDCAIFDRDKYNNLYWRYILALFNKDVYGDMKKTAELFTDILYDTMMPSVLECMRNQPIIILLNRDTDTVRKQMVKRSLKKDVYRSTIALYVEIQNMVYGTIGELCGHCVIDMSSFDYSTDLDQIVLQINNKINIEKMMKPRKVNDGENNIFLQRHITMNSERLNGFEKLYDGAKLLNIFK